MGGGGGRCGGLSFEAFSEFNVSSNVTTMLNEVFQGFIECQGANCHEAHAPVKAAQIVTSRKVKGPSSAELERQHLKFDGVLVGCPGCALFDFFHTLHDVVNTMGGKELLLEGFEEFIKGG